MPDITNDGIFYALSGGCQHRQRCADTRLALHDLWVEHIFCAVANQQGQHKQAEAAATQVVTNAKAIAKFLAGANPYLPEDTLVSMLGAHGGHHVAQIDQLAKRDFAGEAMTWQAMREHMLVLADTLGAALVKQFPDKF